MRSKHAASAMTEGRGSARAQVSILVAGRGVPATDAALSIRHSRPLSTWYFLDARFDAHVP